MISAIPFAALLKISFALLKASIAVGSSRYRFWIFSLLMISSESTLSFNSLIPFIACSKRVLPSTKRGEVTIATVNIPISLASVAITGAAPVPVPPPIPAVMNSILVFIASNLSRMRSMLSIAARRPSSGSLPAPRPLLPRRIRLSTGERSRACWSVLHTMKRTLRIPMSHI